MVLVCGWEIFCSLKRSVFDWRDTRTNRSVDKQMECYWDPIAVYLLCLSLVVLRNLFVGGQELLNKYSLLD